MVAADIVLWSLLVLAVVLVILVSILVRRPSLNSAGQDDSVVHLQSLRSDLERVERSIRDNDSRSFNSAEDRGKALRSEVSDALSKSTNTLVSSLTVVGDAQKAQLESFASILATSTKAVGDDLRQSATHASELQKAQLDTFAKQLSEGVKALDDRMESLRRGVDQKTTELIQTLTAKVDSAQETSTLHAKALREEVANALKAVGDDLRANALTSAEHQKRQLDAFATLLGDSLKALDGRMEALRLVLDQKTADLTNTLVAKTDAAQAAYSLQSKALREEIATSLKVVSDDLRSNAAMASEQQRVQFGGFSTQLTESLGALDGRMEALRLIVDQKIVALTDGVTNRFAAAQEASLEAGKALRQEVQTTLKTVGDDLRQNAEAAATAQRENLGQVSVKLTELSSGIAERFEGFRSATEIKLTEMRQDASTAARDLREEVTNTLKKVGDDLRENASNVAAAQTAGLDTMAKRIADIGDGSQQSQEKLRQSVAEGLTTMRQENEAKLELMRQTVDEKLQGTLEKRLGESFSLVTQQLMQVHEGLGDMQKLATGVGDLKRVLTNVKARGTWGETQLASILEDMLTPDQYARNVKTKDGSNDVVEFCIKIPLLDQSMEHMLLPIDAKFPIEDYERLLEAAEKGDAAGVEQTGQRLEARFRSSAKDIHAKYISPPQTTEYAIMYVPSEGLYAEVVKRPGLVSAITREFNVVVAGPTNLMAMLNAVHAVTRSVTIQQKAGEIAALLLTVQGEFVRYGEAVGRAKKRAESTVKAMEKLDTRQRAMGRALKGVKALEGVAVTVGITGPVLDLTADEPDDTEEELDDTELAETNP